MNISKSYLNKGKIKSAKNYNENRWVQWLIRRNDSLIQKVVVAI